MLIRIKKLIELGFLRDRKVSDEYYTNVYLQAAIIHSLFLKYDVTHETNILNRILQKMDIINNKETELIQRVIENLNG